MKVLHELMGPAEVVRLANVTGLVGAVRLANVAGLVGVGSNAPSSTLHTAPLQYDSERS